MSLTKIRSALIYFSFLLLAAGSGWWMGQREVAVKWKNYRPQVIVVNKAIPPEHRDVDFSLFWEVWDRLQEEYLDPSAINSEKMVYGAISGMTAALGDPYTVFLPPQKQADSKSELAGEFGGVGIQLGFKDNRLAVIAPLDGTPAQRAGIVAGDLIIHIKDSKKNVDVDTDGMNLPDAVDIIRGPKGDLVTLTLIRIPENAKTDQEVKPFEVSLERDTITVKSVTLEFISGDYLKLACVTCDTCDTCATSSIAYIRLSRFGDDTVSEWDKTVGEIIKKSRGNSEIGGLILDVRNNPGGYLNAAVAISSEFFESGVVVEQKGKISSQPFEVKRPGRLIDIPLVVLINKGSASASEIVSGAIQARGRGKLVGDNSFGKGTVQDAQELKGGAGLHVTTARWLLPNGNWIHDEGLKPDVEVEYDKEQSEGKKWDNQVTTAIRELLSS